MKGNVITVYYIENERGVAMSVYLEKDKSHPAYENIRKKVNGTVKSLKAWEEDWRVGMITVSNVKDYKPLPYID